MLRKLYNSVIIHGYVVCFRERTLAHLAEQACKFECLQVVVVRGKQIVRLCVKWMCVYVKLCMCGLGAVCMSVPACVYVSVYVCVQL